MPVNFYLRRVLVLYIFCVLDWYWFHFILTSFRYRAVISARASTFLYFQQPPSVNIMPFTRLTPLCAFTHWSHTLYGL